ncbi:hypothetical protein [uncultured Mediterranean phage]|nr:hypothetical protein [uncultured Mediterranean phage]
MFYHEIEGVRFHRLYGEPTRDGFWLVGVKCPWEIKEFVGKDEILSAKSPADPIIEHALNIVNTIKRLDTHGRMGFGYVE